MKRKGIVLAGGTGTRLFPLTVSVSKQLMPVYDKPMIYYPISILMLAGIKEILVITTPHDLPLFQKLLGSGEHWGISLSYEIQPSPDGLAQAFLIGEKFLKNSPSTLVLGDNIFYGNELPSILKQAAKKDAGATIFGYHVSNPQAYGVIEFDEEGKAISIEEKPSKPKSNFAIPGLYFYDHHAVEYAKKLKPSSRGELEITDLNRLYMEEGSLDVRTLGRGTAWLDTGTHEDLIEAASFIHILERRTGLKVACLEEIALDQKWISKELLDQSIRKMGKSSYAEYLRKIRGSS